MTVMISRIILFVADIDVMIAFYRGVIGLSIVDGSDPGFVILGGGECQLALHRIPEEYLDDGDGNAPREDSYVKFVFRFDDVKSERDRLIAAGARMREVHRYKDLTFCDGVDPEGNIFQISNRV